MKIILTTLEGNIFPVEVSPDLELINLKALCEQETNISTNQMSLSFNGRPLTDDFRTISSYSIQDNDILMVQAIVAPNSSSGNSSAASSLPFIDFSSISVPSAIPSSSSSSNDPRLSQMNQMREMLMNDPVQFEMLKQRFPELANAIQRNDSGI